MFPVTRGRAAVPLLTCVKLKVGPWRRVRFRSSLSGWPLPLCLLQNSVSGEVNKIQVALPPGIKAFLLPVLDGVRVSLPAGGVAAHGQTGLWCQAVPGDAREPRSRSVAPWPEGSCDFGKEHRGKFSFAVLSRPRSACQPLPSSLAADPRRAGRSLLTGGAAVRTLCGRAWLHLLLIPWAPAHLVVETQSSSQQRFLGWTAADACLQLESSRWEYLMQQIGFLILHHWRCLPRHRHPGALPAAWECREGTLELLKVGCSHKEPAERRACSFLGAGRLLRGAALEACSVSGT